MSNILPIGLVISAAALGFNSANLLHIAFDDTKDQTEKVQIYNEHVEQQLERDYGSIGDIGHLVLDNESDTFKFVLDREQACEGDYVVEKDHARIDGKLECSYEVGSR